MAFVVLLLRSLLILFQHRFCRQDPHDELKQCNIGISHGHVNPSRLCLGKIIITKNGTYSHSLWEITIFSSTNPSRKHLERDDTQTRFGCLSMVAWRGTIWLHASHECYSKFMVSLYHCIFPQLNRFLLTSFFVYWSFMEPASSRTTVPQQMLSPKPV